VTDNTFVFYSTDLSGIAGVADNPQFAFRVVAEWESTAIGGTNNNYVGTTTYASGASGGTIRYDLVTVYGNSISGNPNPVPLKIETVTGGRVKLTWTDPTFGLQSAPVPAGAYTNVTGATSPHTNPVTGAAQFFRLRYPVN